MKIYIQIYTYKNVCYGHCLYMYIQYNIYIFTNVCIYIYLSLSLSYVETNHLAQGSAMGNGTLAILAGECAHPMYEDISPSKCISVV